MENEELVKIFNPTLKRREIVLFFLIVVINGLTWIVSDIGLDTCVRVEVSPVIKFSQPRTWISLKRANVVSQSK